MSLTSLLTDKSSRLVHFMGDQFPGTGEALIAYRVRLPIGVEAVRPQLAAGVKPAWSTLGIAIDNRLRLALTPRGLKTGAVARGVGGIVERYLRLRGAGRDIASAIPAVFAHDGSPIEDELILAGYDESLAPFGLEISRALLRAGIALLGEADRIVKQHHPHDRTRSVLLPSDVERRLDSICYAAAWYEETFRAATIFPGTVLGDATATLTLDGLLTAVPEYVIDDMAQVVGLAVDGLATIRDAASPDQVNVGPTFAGSPLVGGADADWIAGALLCDVKSTTTPRRLEARDVWQLIGYTLLDYDDRHGIKQVGWYLSRLGRLVSWDLSDFLRILKARAPIAELRFDLKKRLED